MNLAQIRNAQKNSQQCESPLSDMRKPHESPEHGAVIRSGLFEILGFQRSNNIRYFWWMSWKLSRFNPSSFSIEASKKNRKRVLEL